MKHKSVLLSEVLHQLDLGNRKVIIDATLGLGGHSEAILSDPDFRGKVIGIDQDSKHLKYAENRLIPFAKRFQPVKMNFIDLKDYVSKNSISFDGILFDLGVASPHLDNSERGFSFHANENLDMRMDRDRDFTARQIVNSYSEEELISIFFKYGEEKLARSIARNICRIRLSEEIKTTKQLANIVEDVYKMRRYKHSKKHPATKVFQALRIEVNDELMVLEETLPIAVELLEPKGRILVISYHSLEDRIVKNIFKKLANPCQCPPKIPNCVCGKKPVLEILTKKPITPQAHEIELNPRSRSAKLRVAQKI